MTTHDQNEAARTAESTGADAPRDPGNVITASGTDVGRVRSVNQDSFGELEDSGRGLQLLVIADGMGGHRGGEVASRLAIDGVREIFANPAESPEAMLRSAFEGANAKIFDAAGHDSELAGMGTTGVAILFDSSDTAWIAHVGDSRAYRLRDDQFEQVTDDHSLVGELVRRGQLTSEEARVHPQSNEILRALGTQADVEIELSHVDMRSGDRFLLCSDGLSGMLPDPEIARVLGEASPEEAVRTLIEMANEAGGTDNITVQIAEIGGAGSGADQESISEPQGVAETESEAKAEPSAADSSPSSAPESNSAPPSSETPGEAGAAGSMLRWTMLVVFISAVAWLVYAGLVSSG